MRVTAEQIERANLVNLPDFLKSHGFELKRVGREFILKEHDSLHIKDNSAGERGKWFRFSTNEGGNNIQFVQKFMDLNFVDAVNLLNDSHSFVTLAYDDTHGYVPREEKKKREIQISESADISRIFDYLCHRRNLSLPTVSRLIDEGKISQEERTGNAIFKIFDESGLLVGAEKVGTSGVKFKAIAKDSANGYGFEICRNNGENLYFFESAIDAVAFMELYPNLDNSG